MDIQPIEVDGYEHIVRCEEPACDLVAIIAVHSTTLGPALGGARFYPFESEDAALTDVLRLAEGMTYKSAIAGNDLGGGKSVAIVDRAGKTPEVLRAFGRFVHELGGRYITAADFGTNTNDMTVIREMTPYVGGLPTDMGGSGDPSRLTAFGVFHAMRAAAAHRFGSAELARRRVIVSGVGKVGSALVANLVAAGADVTVADINMEITSALRRSHGVEVVDVGDAHLVDTDIYAPCALGGGLSSKTIPELGCEIVVGAANNQLADDHADELLADRGILYVPDYLANGGGVINIAEEQHPSGYDVSRARARVEAIFDRTAQVLQTADEQKITPVAAAARMVESRLANATPARS